MSIRAHRSKTTAFAVSLGQEFSIRPPSTPDRGQADERTHQCNISNKLQRWRAGGFQRLGTCSIGRCANSIGSGPPYHSHSTCFTRPGCSFRELRFSFSKLRKTCFVRHKCLLWGGHSQFGLFDHQICPTVRPNEADGAFRQNSASGSPVWVGAGAKSLRNDLNRLLGLQVSLDLLQCSQSQIASKRQPTLVNAMLQCSNQDRWHPSSFGSALQARSKPFPWSRAPFYTLPCGKFQAAKRAHTGCSTTGQRPQQVYSRRDRSNAWARMRIFSLLRGVQCKH